MPWVAAAMAGEMAWLWVRCVTTTTKMRALSVKRMARKSRTRSSVRAFEVRCVVCQCH